MTDAKKVDDAVVAERKKHVYDFLRTQPVGVLSSVDEKGLPHAVVIYFAIKKDLEFTFTTKRDTKKHANLKRDGHVILVAFDAESQTTVQIIGMAVEITGKPEAQSAFDHTMAAAMATSESGMPPISKLYAGHYVAYKVVPKQSKMAVFLRPDPGGYDMFETVDF